MLFALVALWLPATLHCRLEASGLMESSACASEHTAEKSTDECNDTICPTIEGAILKESAANLTVLAPVVHECLLLLPAFTILSGNDAESCLSPERFAPPLELSARWQFLTRAVLPARAPGLNA